MFIVYKLNGGKLAKAGGKLCGVPVFNNHGESSYDHRLLQTKQQQV